MVRLRTFSPVASNSLRALVEALRADRHELLEDRAQLHARVDAATLATQPLPVEEMRASEVGPQPRAGQSFNGFAV